MFNFPYKCKMLRTGTYEFSSHTVLSSTMYVPQTYVIFQTAYKTRLSYYTEHCMYEYVSVLNIKIHSILSKTASAQRIHFAACIMGFDHCSSAWLPPLAAVSSC